MMNCTIPGTEVLVWCVGILDDMTIVSGDSRSASWYFIAMSHAVFLYCMIIIVMRLILPHFYLTEERCAFGMESWEYLVRVSRLTRLMC